MKQEEEMKIISPIAIDMGAKNTGVYLNHFIQGEDPTTSGHIAGKTIVIDSTNITWSQANRTQKRHQIRSSKRRKLAKRLLKLILNEYHIKPNQAQDKYLNGLLNRRGYNRIETTEEQEDVLQSKVVNEFFQPTIFGDNNNGDFLERLNSEINIKDDESKKCWEDILRNKVFALLGKQNSEFKEHIKDEYNKDEIAELSKAFTPIKDLIAKQIDNYKTGHLHRKDYLEKIATDIKNNEILKLLLTNELTDTKLAYLIGNISNLQLRILRKYFNDKAMKSGDQWRPENLHLLFFKWVRGWHAKQDIEKQNRKDLLALGGKEKNIIEVFTTSNPTLKIATFLKHDKNEKYNNPYSIDQLYNHLETEISGFSKTDKWNTEENAWRNKEQSIEILSKADEVITLTASNASRLTADSIRPFDGMLDRIISRQAYEIAGMKIQQIESLDIDKNDALFVPIFMEQNRFAFEQSLHEIKVLKNIKKKAKDRVEKGLSKQETQWQDKDNRIKKNEHCPYTDENIVKGEIDHIIPQSESKKRHDVVFNSEANLIYCSSTGNHQKGNNRYSFDQLKPHYLTEIFGCSNKSKIQQEIRCFVDGLDDSDTIAFHNLATKEQNYLRHALFISDLDGKTFPILKKRYKTFVNGTQGYLGKQIRKLLQEAYPNVEVKTYQIPAPEVSQLRTVLGEYDEDLKKPERQGAFSHVVDAALVLATALQNLEIAEELQTTHVAQLSEKGQWLKKLLPRSADVQHIVRRPKYRKDLSSTQIFKEGLYGERFMPILLDNEKLYYGFALDNCHEITTNNKQGIETLEFYFELLKPFLYTGSTRKKNKKLVTGNLLDNQQKYSYLSIDKTKALNHLQKCAKEVCSDEEIQQAEQLEKLRYSVEKKEIKSVLLTKKENKLFFITEQKLFYLLKHDKKISRVSKKNVIELIELPAKKDWERLITHSIADYKDEKTTLKECFGKPEQVEIYNSEMVNFWQDLENESGLDIEYLKNNLLKKNDEGEFTKQAGIIPKTVFNKKVKDNDILKSLESSALLQKSFGLEFKTKEALIPQASWDKLFEEFFLLHKPKNTTEYVERANRKKENRGNHHQVRKEYSLPILSAPSGGFRIKRKNTLTGEVVYQVSAVEGFATKGYDETLRIPALINRLSNSPNIASLDGKQDRVDKICYFDEWKDIKLPPELAENITSLSYAIGSKDRFSIRVSMTFDRFRNLLLTDFWKKLAKESKLEKDLLRNNLLKKNDNDEFKEPDEIISKEKFNEIIKENDKLKSLENDKLLQGRFDIILDEKIKHFSAIPVEVKEPKQNDSWKFKKTDFQEYFSSRLLGKPRSNLFVERVSAEQIILSYIVESTNKEMKTAYQNGTPVK